MPSRFSVIGLALLVTTLALPAWANVVFVDYDNTTATAHGEFPNRAQLADLIDALHGAGAKAVVVKFFLDGPGKEPDNSRLVNAIAKGRTVLQATINREPPTSRDLPPRFRVTGKLPFEPAIGGDEGWLPLARFSDKAARVCFADVQSPESLPMLERFGGHPVFSLYACVLAEVRGADPRFESGTALFGSTRIPLNQQGEVMVKLDVASKGGRFPASRIFASNGWQADVRGKVAVLMYTGPKSPMLPYKGKPEKVHDLFAAQIQALQGRISGR